MSELTKEGFPRRLKPFTTKFYGMAKDWIAFGSVRALTLPWRDLLKFSKCLLELNDTFLRQPVGGVGVLLFGSLSLDSARNPKGSAFQGRQIAWLCRPQRIRRKSPQTQRKNRTFKEARTPSLLFIFLSHP